jgi:hypothetical protein
MEVPDLSHMGLDNLPPNESSRTRAIAAMGSSFTLVLVTLGSRLYSRLLVMKTGGWDDWTISLATVSGARVFSRKTSNSLQICSLIQLVFNGMFIHYGEGRHVFYLSEHHVNEAYRFSNLVMFPYILCTAITKISVAFMVLRLTLAKWMRYYMYALIASLVLVNGACVVILFAFCWPTAAFWDITIQDAQCWDTRVLTIASSAQGCQSVFGTA